jgi:hypothetical protein
MPRRGQDDGFRLSTWGPTHNEQAVRFERAQAMTEVTVVRVEGTHQLLMTTGHHPTGPLVIQPPTTAGSVVGAGIGGRRPWSSSILLVRRLWLVPVRHRCGGQPFLPCRGDLEEP